MFEDHLVTVVLSQAERNYLIDLMYAIDRARHAPQDAAESLGSLSRQAELWRRIDTKLRTATERESTPGLRATPAGQRRQASSRTDATWRQSDLFPIIARLIREIHSITGAFVTHEELKQALLDDREAASEIERVAHIQQRQPSEVASNMIAWFSQTITAGRSQYGRELERIKVDRKWAYRPAPPG